MEAFFVAFLAASLLHMGEEYAYPGGFPEQMRRLNPRFASLVTARAAVVLNGLQVALCLLAIGIGPSAPVFGLSVAGLLLVNGLIHIGACVRVRGYAPGAVTGALLYLPLSLTAYAVAIGSGRLTSGEVALTIVLGALYQGVPIAYFTLATLLGRTS